MSAAAGRRIAVASLLVACGSSPSTMLDAQVPPPDAPIACTTQDGWNPAAPLPRGPAQETAAVAVGGKIYVLGGFDATPKVIDAVQVFDTATCAWTEGPPLPRPVHHANAAVVGDTIFVVGALEAGNFVAMGHVWSWNPATETAWTVHPMMPANTQRGAAVVGVIGGTIILAGGLRGTSVAEVSSYAPATETWDTTLPPLPVVRDHGCGGVVGETLYVTGGRANGGAPSPTVYAYAPGGMWTTRAPMPTGRGGSACGVVGDRILVVGGEGNAQVPSGVFPQAEAYDPATDTWATLPPMTTPRHGMGGAAWDAGSTCRAARS